jgi:hypothetical protein
MSTVSASHHHDHDPPDTATANQQDGYPTGADVHANTEIVDSPVLVELCVRPDFPE